MRHKVFIGDVLKVLKTLPDESVDCIVTSPPYWGLRDYGEEANTVWGGDPDCEHEWGGEIKIKYNPVHRGQAKRPWQEELNKNFKNEKKFGKFCKKCGAWYGQLGLEPTLDMFIEHMLQITAELKRVLKKTGVMFWNHGDNYSGNMGKRSGWSYVSGLGNKKDGTAINFKANYSVPQKSLCLQNFRLVLHMVDEQGWILRNVIVWHKPNHLPASVKDRFANAYEPVFMLVKSKKYWFDLDAVRVPHKTPLHSPGNKHRVPLTHHFDEPDRIWGKPLGKNPGDVWTIPTQPFPDAHFATFPEKLVEPMIKAGCPRWICKKCGKARERVVKTVGKEVVSWGVDRKARVLGTPGKPAMRNINVAVGWTDCGCDAGWEAGTVLDPFVGSGTTMLVAEKLGRNSVGIEINPKYVDMIKKRFKPFLGQADLDGNVTVLEIVKI